MVNNCKKREIKSRHKINKTKKIDKSIQVKKYCSQRLRNKFKIRKIENKMKN